MLIATWNDLMHFHLLRFTCLSCLWLMDFVLQIRQFLAKERNQ